MKKKPIKPPLIYITREEWEEFGRLYARIAETVELIYPILKHYPEEGYIKWHPDCIGFPYRDSHYGDEYISEELVSLQTLMNPEPELAAFETKRKAEVDRVAKSMETRNRMEYERLKKLLNEN
jgi:hypothetical protein